MSNYYEFSQKVTNRELDLLGEEQVCRLITLAFLQSLVNTLMEKVQVTAKPCELVGSVDYTLAPFQFSEQFGTEYTASLIVLTREELEEYAMERCRNCGLDTAAQQMEALEPEYLHQC